MKIIITEKQADKLFGEKIKCKCGHYFNKENKEKQPYLCHMCGFYKNFYFFNFNYLLYFWKVEFYILYL
ncbi:MAG: hypothetical protein ACK55I_24255, partial [bacterium]